MMGARNEESIALTTSTETLKKCVLAQDMGFGDCVQLAGSSISLQRSEDDAELATFIWRTTTLTYHHSPWGHDTWQQSFIFVTDDGQSVARVPQDGHLRGADMDTNNKNYSVTRSGTVNINPALWDQIAQVTWFPEC